jgi:hypothetical protein
LVYPTITRLEGELLRPSIAHNCALEAKAQAGAIVESQSLTCGLNARTARIVGVSPDGVATVTVLARDGPPIVAAVIRNAYDVMVNDPVAIRFVVNRESRSYTHTIRLAIVQAGGVAPPAGRHEAINCDPRRAIRKPRGRR